MWKIDGGLIQVVLGTAVERLSTARSYRDILEAGFEPEALPRLVAAGALAPGGLLVAATDELRSSARAVGIPVPPVQYRVNTSISPAAVVFFMGIEQFSGKVSSISEITEFLRRQILRYGAPGDATESRLRHQLNLISNSNRTPQDQLSSCEFVYYHAELRGIRDLAVLALALAGKSHIDLDNRSKGIELLAAAHQRIDREKVNSWLLPELTLACSDALVEIGDWVRARAGYGLALAEAWSAQDTVNAFLALVGIAQTSAATGDFQTATSAFRIIESVVTTKDAAEAVKSEVESVVRPGPKRARAKRRSIASRMKGFVTSGQLKTAVTWAGVTAGAVGVTIGMAGGSSVRVEGDLIVGGSATIGDKNAFCA